MRVLLGICGSVAAYKAAEVARLLQTRGFEVEAAMTASAAKFVAPLTLASLTGRAVHTSLWQPDGAVEAAAAGEAAEFAIEHIAVMQRCDAMVIAPATASTIARLAHGMADDFLSAVYLANTRPVLVAPAMNVNMWRHPATQENVETLRRRGVRVLEPESGYLACGMTGDGRLAAVEAIAEAVAELLQPRMDLAGETVLVTAGGTREALDPVRFLGNRSSGRMGYALAEAAVARGAKVVLVTAASLAVPQGVEAVPVTTAAEMRQAVLARLPEATMVLKAAAVADFRPMEASPHKLRREQGLYLRLEATEDIVAEVVRKRRGDTLVLAFAAEHGEIEPKGRAKLERKGVDAVFANDILADGIGFDAEQNAGVLLTRTQTLRLPRLRKRELADRLLDGMLEMRLGRAMESEVAGGGRSAEAR